MTILTGSQGRNKILTHTDLCRLTAEKLLELKNKQLITAGEIIKAFMNFKPVVGNVVYYHEEYEKVYKQAESFLEEVEQ